MLLFAIAEYSKLSKEDKDMYDVSLKRKWDAEAVRQYQVDELRKAREEAREEGFAKGIEKGIEEGRSEEHIKAEAEKRSSAIKMLQNGFDVKVISEIIGLPVEEIEKLK